MPSKLPPTPARGGGHSKMGRPLPPEPTSGDGDVPPPLPSRPAPARPGNRNPQISPSVTSEESTDDGETYCEADTVVNPQQNSQEEPLELYEECAEVVQTKQLPLPPLPPPPQDEFQEMYDQCDIKTAPAPTPTPTAIQTPEPFAEDLYEEPAQEQLEYECVSQPTVSPPPLPPQTPRAPIPPTPIIRPTQTRPTPTVPPDEMLEAESTYEAMPPASTPPPPPPPDSPRAPIPPPPINKHPTSRLPMVPSPSENEAPQLPSRPTAQVKTPKRMSGGAAQLGLSDQQIGNAKGRLRKVGSSDHSRSFEKTDNDVKTEETETESAESETDSVRNRILRFQNEASAGKPKPSLPIKPKFPKVPGPPSKSGGGFSAVKKPDSPPPPVPTQIAPPPVTPQSAPAPVTSQSAPPLPPVTAQSAPNHSDDGYNDDIYDDALSVTADPLSSFDWYHSNIDRKQAQTKLENFKMDSAFLVRKSGKGGAEQPYTLVVIYNNYVYNLMIRVREDSKVALGNSKTDELAFVDVPELISHHRNSDVILVNTRENKQYKTLLTKSPKL